MPLKLTTYYQGKDIPELPGKNTFHSKELFQIYEATPGYTPLLIVATEDGKPVARLLAAIRKAKKWLPSSLVKHCVVYSEGEFLDESLSDNKEKAEEVFGDMARTSHAGSIAQLCPDRIPKPEQFDVRLSGFQSQRLFPCQLVTGTQFVTQHEKDGRPIQSVAHPADQKRTQKWSQSRGSTYCGRNTRLLTNATQSLFFPHTQIFSCQRFLPSHEQRAN